MEQDNEQALKPIRIERLIQSIDEVDEKINKLLAKKESLKNELENAQKNEILAIVSSQYKTPEEMAAFIRQAKNGGFVLEPVKQKQGRKEDANEFLEDGAGEVQDSR
jgi:DNA repair exonuclease SbcCD ATPase subunit